MDREENETDGEKRERDGQRSVREGKGESERDSERK